MHLRSGVLIVAATVSCSPFASDGAPPGGDADGGSSSSSSSSGNVPPGTPPGSTPPPPPPPAGGCSTFKEDFEAFATGAGNWQLTVASPASVAIGTGVAGKALIAHFDAQTQGTKTAYASRSFNRTPKCSLVVELDVRARPQQDSSRLNSIVLQGKSGAVTIHHAGSFWYLDAGSSQTQLTSFPAYNTSGRIKLELVDAGSHVAVTYTFGSNTQLVDQNDALFGDGFDLRLGAELVGATSGATESEFDNLVVTY